MARIPLWLSGVRGAANILLLVLFAVSLFWVGRPDALSLPSGLDSSPSWVGVKDLFKGGEQGRAKAPALANVMSLNAAGQSVPVIPFGGGVILVVSDNCSACEGIINEWAESTDGGPLVHLHLVHVGGAEAANKRIALVPGKPSLRPGQVGGPDGEVSAWLEVMGIKRLPALLHVGPDGSLLDRAEGEVRNSEEWLRRAREK